MKKSKIGLSRREFSRNLALIAATAAIPSGAAFGKDAAAQATNNPTTQEPDASKLTPEGEAQYQTILSRYGSRLSDEQKADVRRLVGAAQKTGEDMQKFELRNWNEPATIFRVYVAEKNAEDGK